MNYDAVFRSSYIHPTDENEYLRILRCAGMTEANGTVFRRSEDKKAVAFGNDCSLNEQIPPWFETLYKTPTAPLIRDGETALDYEARLDAANVDTDSWEDATPEFIYALQDLIPENKALIIEEAGAEGLRYITGCAYVVSKAEVRYFDLRGIENEILDENNLTVDMDY